MTRTRTPCWARAAARLTVLVVLPTPPFWLAMVMTRRSGGRGHASEPAWIAGADGVGGADEAGGGGVSRETTRTASAAAVSRETTAASSSRSGAAIGRSSAGAVPAPGPAPGPGPGAGPGAVGSEEGGPATEEPAVAGS